MDEHECGENECCPVTPEKPPPEVVEELIRRAIEKYDGRRIVKIRDNNGQWWMIDLWIHRYMDWQEYEFLCAERPRNKRAQ